MKDVATWHRIVLGLGMIWTGFDLPGDVNPSKIGLVRWRGALQGESRELLKLAPFRPITPLYEKLTVYLAKK